MGCYLVDMPDGAQGFICGDLGPHCAHCQRAGDFLCDFPVGRSKSKTLTCDAPLCRTHGAEVAPDIHYCPGHYAHWARFRDERGVAEHLRNVIAFKHEKAEPANSDSRQPVSEGA